MTLLWLVACGEEPRWSIDGVLAPGHDRFDADHDGKVTKAEYEKLAWQMPAFDKADADGDGDLSLDEYVALVGATDPQSVANSETPSPRPSPSPAGADMRPNGAAWMVLEALREEVLAIDPAADVPTPEEMEVVRHDQTMSGAEVHALHARIEAAADAAHLDLPPTLRVRNK